MKKEMEVLRETGVTLERQVREVRAEVVVMEELVAVERTKVQTLETVRGELFAEREALRRREGQLQEEIERFRQEVMSMRVRLQDLTVQLNEKKTSQEEAQKEVLVSVDCKIKCFSKYGKHSCIKKLRICNLPNNRKILFKV